MSGGDYRWHRKIHQAMGGTVTFNSTGVSGTAVLSGSTGVASGSIHVQILTVIPTTAASGVTWGFLDSSGSLIFAGPIDMSVIGAPSKFDFGDAGYRLPTGASLQISGSASGAAGLVTWEGYRAYQGGTSVGVFPTSGASGTTP